MYERNGTHQGNDPCIRQSPSKTNDRLFQLTGVITYISEICLVSVSNLYTQLTNLKYAEDKTLLAKDNST